jgi:peptide/nickel transport system permease protein
MREYLVKRIILSLVIIYVIATLQFIIFQVISPIDPTATYMIADPRFKKEQRDQLMKLFGLDQPLHIRYHKYIVNMFTWNFGFSFRSMKPVAQEMSWRLVNTVLLLGSALVATIMVGVPLGILAASRRGTKVDVLAIGAGIFTWGVPTFFIQLLAVLFLSYYTYVWFGFPLFPHGKMHSVPPPTDMLSYMADTLWHLALPMGTLVVAGFGSWALYTRNILLDALTQDYIVTARAKGLSERTVLYRHAFRSILPPIVTMVTLSVPGIVTGAIITEFVFTWPGIGQWYIESLFQGDYPVVQAVIFIYTVLMVTANIVADILYGILDPRIRIGVRR